LLCEKLEDRTLLAGHSMLAATPLAFNAQKTAAVAGFLASARDVDFYALRLTAGDTVRAAVDAQKTGSALDSALRMFDSIGRPIASNDDFDGRDPRLTFQAAATGTYFVGVSSSGNFTYNPVDPVGQGLSTGMYSLKLSSSTAPLLPDLVGT